MEYGHIIHVQVYIHVHVHVGTCVHECVVWECVCIHVTVW